MSNNQSNSNNERANVHYFDNYVKGVVKNSDKTKNNDYSHPIYNGGEPPMGTNLDTRVANLEISVRHMQNDITEIRSDIRNIWTEFHSLRRWIVGVGISVVLGLGAIVIGQATWFQLSLDRNWEIANKALDKIDAKFDALKDEIKKKSYPHP